jgi:hypothetical protein
MNSPMPSSAGTFRATAERFFAALVRAFHQYGTWLVSITWKRFFLLSLLLLILAGILSELPPFAWKTTETVVDTGGPRVASRDVPAKVRVDRSGGDKAIDITIGGQGIRIVKAPAAKASDAAPAAAAPEGTGNAPGKPGLPAPPPGAPDAPGSPSAQPPAAPQPPGPPAPSEEELRKQITIVIPENAKSDDVRRAVEEARDSIVDAIREARDDHESSATSSPVRVRTTRTSFGGDSLPEFAFFWIFASAIIKFTYKGQLRAEARAAVASEAAEAETLKRQVVEARMAAMQAQVEPHFLFNTLASIDHLIETDPARASKMQKDLIALLRASMPTMREGAATGLRDLGSELAVVRPYLGILKVRMDERLDARIDIPDGLKSAAFPPMMLQSLVENAIKHGLEPKPEGGTLHVKAEVVDGALVVSVADTGLGFGASADTQGTGTGLANIRERLELLYGREARLAISANVPSGTIASVTVPYRSVAAASAAAASSRASGGAGTQGGRA